MRTIVYPGSFDPMTNGHLNLLERGLQIFDRVIIAVSFNIKKKALFTTEERMSMVREAIGDTPRIEVDSFNGLLVDYAKNKGAQAILRGLRALSDFEYEFQMAHMNHRLNSSIETVFLMTGQEHFYISSSLVREVAFFGGDVTGLVPESVEEKLLLRVQERHQDQT